MSKIRIMNGPYRGREKTVGEKPLTIGRDAEAGIQILDRSASRFHCEIFPVGGMFFVRDLDSKNGTYVNDERLADEELLRVGDIIKIGTTEMVFEAGTSMSDDDSSNRIAYNDDPDVLSNTLEFRLDELSDISEPIEHEPPSQNVKGLRILYQVGRLMSDPNEGSDKEARVLDCLVQNMPAECALIFRRDPASGKLVPGAVRTSAPHVRPVISRSIIKKTFSENKALHSANAQDDERFDRTASVVAKGIRSVICVPLSIGGHTRGVLYLSRVTGAAPFDQFDLELVSACAIQIGLAHHGMEERRRHRSVLWQMMVTMIRALETCSNSLGTSERCARTCQALAEAMHLSASSRDRLRQAGLLHRFTRLVSDGRADARPDVKRSSTKAMELLESVDDLEPVLPLVRMAYERVDGSGPLKIGGDDLDTEARILAVATAFEEKIVNDAGADPNAIIEVLIADDGFDRNVARLLQGCHLDGSLYKKDAL
ncbi:MAG: FHA domain-containing protein [Planctomycetes bacterium]|nr:FHA domain-containing protein [Planctomycetota bacterium]